MMKLALAAILAVASQAVRIQQDEVRIQQDEVRIQQDVEVCPDTYVVPNLTVDVGMGEVFKQVDVSGNELLDKSEVTFFLSELVKGKDL